MDDLLSNALNSFSKKERAVYLTAQLVIELYYSTNLPAKSTNPNDS